MSWWCLIHHRDKLPRMESRRLVRLSFAIAWAIVFHHAIGAEEPTAKPTKQLILPGEVFSVAGQTAFIRSPSSTTATATKPLDTKTHDLPATELVPAAFKPPDLVVPASGPRPVRYDLDVR
jgi:hypothetical protein